MASKSNCDSNNASKHKTHPDRLHPRSRSISGTTQPPVQFPRYNTLFPRSPPSSASTTASPVPQPQPGSVSSRIIASSEIGTMQANADASSAAINEGTTTLSQQRRYSIAGQMPRRSSSESSSQQQQQNNSRRWSAVSTSSSSDDNSAVVDDVVDVGGGASTAPLGRRLSLSARTLMGFSDKTAPRRINIPRLPPSPPLTAKNSSTETPALNMPTPISANATESGGGLFTRARRASFKSVQRPPTPTGERILAGHVSFD